MKSDQALFAAYFEIKSPSDLYQIAESLKDFLQKGLIMEMPGPCSVLDVASGKPFPADLIHIEFGTIPGGTKYLLSCDTYRGAGGVFRRL